MKVAATFASRPLLSTAVAIVALVVGALAALRIPVAMYPTLARPAISVSCTYPGANAIELMNTVAGPLEEKINGVEGMDRMTSSCYDSGAYSLTVNFAVGYDRDVALMKVQSKVQQALSMLPQEVKNTGVTVESGTTEELGILTLRSKEGRLTRDQVADFMFGVVNPAVLRVSGVGKSVVKDNKIAVRVWMQPERLASLGLCSDDVVSAIKAQNVQASLGTVGARPAGDSTSRVMTLVSKGRLSTPEEFGEIIVATDASGGQVRLKDVARIGTGPQGYSYSALYDETPAVYAVIYLLPGANPLDTMRAIKSELKGLEPFFPADLAWDMTYDSTEYMKKALFGAGVAMSVAAAIVFAALWFALGSFWGAVAVLASLLVPISITVSVLAFSGMQINLPILYAYLASFALSAGMAAWSFVTVRRGGLPGMEQFAAAIVVACAALPLMLVDGVQGVLFKQFSVVFALMALASAFNAVIVIPALAGLFAKKTALAPSSPPHAWRLAPALAVLLAVLAALASYVMADRLPKEFVPDEDMGVLYVDCKLAEGTQMEVTAEMMRRLYREVRSLGGIEKSATLLGESVINGAGENQAKMMLVLKDWSKRGADETSYAIAQRVRKIAQQFPEMEAYVLRIPPVKGMGSQGGVSVLLQAIGDNDPVKFSREVLRMRGEFEKSPLVESVTGGFYTDTPHLRVKIDRAKCELLGVPMSSVYATLQHNLGSIYVNDVNLGTQVNRVTAMADWCGRAKPEDVEALYVRSKKGSMVPVGSLVTCSEELGPRACYRCDQYLYCTEQFVPKPGVSTSEAVAEVLRICREKLPPGFVNDWANFTYESLKSRGDEGLLTGLSLLAVFLVLVAYRESLIKAIVGMTPSIAAVFGAILALSISGVSLSVYSRYVIVMLPAATVAMSIVSNSGARARTGALLPLLAALTALPLVFAFGPGSAGGRSLGVALFGGCAAYAAVAALLPMRRA